MDPRQSDAIIRWLEKVASFSNLRRHVQRKEGPDGPVFRPHDFSINTEVVRKHLSGELSLAVYLLRADQTHIAVLDGDNHDGECDPVLTAKHARKLSAELARRNMSHTIVRSAGGKGFHIWMLWRNAQRGALVRRFLKAVLSECGYKSGAKGLACGEVEIFPKQDFAGLRGGSNITLPFARQSVPLASDCLTVIPWDRYTPPALENLLNSDIDPAELPKERTKRRQTDPITTLAYIVTLLQHIDPSDYDTWIKVGIILRIAFDDEGFEAWLEWSEKASNFESCEKCWQKWRTFNSEGTPGFGGIYKLAREGGWLGSDHAFIHETNERYGLLCRGNKTLVIDKEASTSGDQPIVLMGTGPFRDRLNVEPPKSKEGENDPIPAGTFWISHQEASRYHDLVFDPSLPPGENGLTWNMWRGFGVEPKPGDWSLFRTFVFEVLAAGDAERGQWLINWMALAIQKPASVIGTAPVLLGEPGIGKTFFAKAFGRLWDPHFITLTHRTHVTGRFNSQLAGRRVVLVDEGTFGGDKASAGIIKTRLTDDVLLLESKGIDPIPMPNRTVWIVASNDRDAVAADPGDRRWTVFEVSSAHKEDHAYFAAIQAQLDAGGYGAMLYDLQRHDWQQGPDPRKVIKSEALFEQIIGSADPVARYLHSLLQNGSLPDVTEKDPAETTIAALYADMSLAISGRHYLTDADLGKRLRKIIPSVTTRSGGSYVDPRTHNRRRSMAYRFPSLAKARRQYAEWSGMPVKWPDGPEDWLGPDIPF